MRRISIGLERLHAARGARAEPCPPDHFARTHAILLPRQVQRRRDGYSVLHPGVGAWSLNGFGSFHAHAPKKKFGSGPSRSTAGLAACR
jgi:hypothetical protein